MSDPVIHCLFDEAMSVTWERELKERRITNRSEHLLQSVVYLEGEERGGGGGEGG